MAGLALAGLLACEREVAEVLMTPPSLEGPLSEGRWERRSRDGLTFWPPNPRESRLPEMIDFSCGQMGGRLRLTVTGKMDDTGLWIAGEDRTARTLILATENGVSSFELYAGKRLLPAVELPADHKALEPLRSPGGTFAINAFGSETYRLEIVPEIGEVIERCRRGR
ncbi:MAG: hypothetical protein V2I43_05350 [Parvularcula sp.]|nr:hypothetical protein [Parvularcula sp.]